MKLAKIDHTPRQSGKTVLMEKALAEYLKRNPDATVVRYQNGECRVEKPVKEISQKVLT